MKVKEQKYTYHHKKIHIPSQICMSFHMYENCFSVFTQSKHWPLTHHMRHFCIQGVFLRAWGDGGKACTLQKHKLFQIKDWTLLI